MEITKEDNTTEGNPLTTEVQKIDWLNKKIKNLEYLIEYDSNIDAEETKCSLQMLRELLSIKMATCRANAVKKIKENLSRDAAEFLKDFGGLTDAEKMSIKSLICLRTKC